MGNSQLVNLFAEIQQGDTAALKKIGMNQDQIAHYLHRNRLAHYLAKESDIPEFKPVSISLFLTNRCTMQCSYCYAEGGSLDNSMPWGMLTTALDLILQNVRDNNLDRITVFFHGGGDVSADWELLVRAREYLAQITAPYNITVFTYIGLNGVLNNHQRKWIVKNINRATISIDGTPEIQNILRPLKGGGESFKIVSDTLKYFDQMSFNYGIRSTITSDNVSQMDRIVSFFCKEFKVKNIKMEPMYPRGRGAQINNKVPDVHEFVTNFRKAKYIAKQERRNLIYSGARLQVLTNTFCKASGNSCALTPDGNVSSCYEVISLDDPYADVFIYGKLDVDNKTFVIDHNKRKNLYDLSVLKNPKCENCFCKWHCAGDCPVKSIDNKLHQKFDRCLINRELTKDQLIEALQI